MSELHDKARTLSAVAAGAGLTSIADTIRDLLAENERLSLLAEENEGAFKVWRRRCEAAETRLRALCEQEPVATGQGGNLFWVSRDAVERLTVDGSMNRIELIPARRCRNELPQVWKTRMGAGCVPNPHQRKGRAGNFRVQPKLLSKTDSR